MCLKPSICLKRSVCLRRSICRGALLVVATAAIGAAAAKAQAGGGYASLYRQMRALAPDSTAAAVVSGLTLRRDRAVFELSGGTLYLCTNVAGRRCGAVYRGPGRCMVLPPTEVEREQLRRVTGGDTSVTAFTSLVLLFADSTIEELRRTLTFARHVVDPECCKTLALALGFVVRDEPKCIDPPLANALLNNETLPYFYADMRGAGGAAAVFQVDPYAGRYSHDEVSLMRIDRGRGEPFRESICRWRYGDQAASTTERPGERLAIEKERIDLSIDEGLAVTASAELTARLKRPATAWFDLHLYRELRVDSIVWGGGARAEFFQTGEGILWVRNDPRAYASGMATMRIYYRGALFRRAVNWITMKSSNGWLPHHAEAERAIYDFTFHYPQSLTLAGCGTRGSVREENGVVTARWTLDIPAQSVSFGIGRFEETRLRPDSIAPITVYRGPYSSSGVSEQIAWDVEHSIKFFEYLYGRLPCEEFNVTEIPEAHGQAFPGLIHLSEATFERNDQSGTHEQFRSHEVAHQWWCIGVDFDAYHDQWLTEGFAEYSGLMFMQAVVKDNDKFFKMLRQYRDAIITHRGASDQGPIWLGYRNATLANDDGYFVAIYQKGAWVLHMLRNMLLDLQTMKEDRYRAMMRDFFATYSGRVATTDDFRRVVEKHAGMPMDWFFRQWVYGTGVPSYAWASKVEDAGNGKYRLLLRVTQKNVPDGFKMYVPVKVDFGDGRFARLRVLVGAGEPQLPVMPLKPKAVTFNDLESVLCESEEVDWE